MLRWVLVLVASLTLTVGVRAAPILGVKWGDPTFGTGATITYSFVADGVALSETSWGNVPGPNVGVERFLPADYRQAVEFAFGAWSAVADLRFVEVADGGEAFGEDGPGDIRFWGAYTKQPYLAWTYFPFGGGEAGDIFLNSLQDFGSAFDPVGFRLEWVLVHEIGHALGLLHNPFDGTSAMFPYYPVGEGRLNASDIAAIRRLYGPATRVSEPAAVAILAAGWAILWSRRRRRP